MDTIFHWAPHQTITHPHPQSPEECDSVRVLLSERELELRGSPRRTPKWILFQVQKTGLSEVYKSARRVLARIQTRFGSRDVQDHWP